MLTVEKCRPADACPNRPRENPALANLQVVNQRVEPRPGQRVARAVSPRRDLDHDAGIGWAVGPFGELDMPVAVVFELVDPPHPCGDAAGPKLALQAGSAAVPRPKLGRRPAR